MIIKEYESFSLFLTSYLGGISLPVFAAKRKSFATCKINNNKDLRIILSYLSKVCIFVDYSFLLNFKIKNNEKTLLIFFSLFMMPSCYTTWTSVGNYNGLESQGLESYKYSHKKQLYLFGGLIPLGHAQANVPNEPCLIKTKFKFVDYLITGVTLDILCARTTEVYALKGGSNYQQEYTEPKVEQPTTPKEEPVAKAKETKKPDEEVQASAAPAKTETVTQKSAPVATQSNLQQAGGFKVGDRVLYQLKGQWWYYATVTQLTPGNATIELQNGATTDRALNEIMKVQYIH